MTEAAARRWQQVKRLIDELLMLEPARRLAALERIGAEDPRLKSEVESLLATAHEQNAGLVAQAETLELGRRDRGGAWVGRVLGAYRLIEQAGEGAMGTVYRAVRTDGLYDRPVAVKVIRGELSTELVQRRFASERQRLARLEHPGIARLLDAGLVDTGQPYLVTEYVLGLPLTAYCDQRQLPIGERLLLFLQVLSAVQHAHAHLIIHRDLKPSNILVSHEGQVRLLDLGIAQLLTEGQSRETAFTLLGGSAHAAPEQVAGDEVTTATDVYSLGVLLQEVLTGEGPYALESPSRSALEEAILRAEPVPLTRARLDAAAAQARGTTPRMLARILRGDLEAIVAQALRKDPQERYPTASAFAEDIVRLLKDEVVLAQRAGTMYRARKFARRHSGLVAAMSAVALVFLGGLAATLYALERAERQRDRALDAQSSALTQTAAALLKEGDIPGSEGIILEVLSRESTAGSYAPQTLSVFHETRSADSQVLALTGHTDRVWAAAFSPDGQRVVTASSDGTARIWDAVLGLTVRRLTGHTGFVYRAVFSPDGSRVLTASADKTARIWDAATGRELVRLIGHTRALTSAAFSADGQHVVTASADGTARVWDAPTGRQRVVLHVPGGVTSATFSPDGHRVVTAAADGSVRVWDVSKHRQLMVLNGHTGAVWWAAYSRDGKRIVTASDDRTARVWDAASGRLLAVLSGHTDRVNVAAFSADGRRIVTASDDGTARIWDAATGRQLALLGGHTDRVSWAAFSPDGQRVVTASTDGTARIWDVGLPRDVIPLQGHTGRVWSAAFSPDGLHVVTASFDRTARIWSSATGRPVMTLRGHAEGLSSAAYSPDGQRVVTASDDRTARIFDVATGRQLVVLRGHTGAVTSAAFSPDGERVVTSSLDRTARIWDATTGRELLSLAGHGGRVWSARFSPDGRLVVTASSDHTARLWDATTGRQVMVFSGHTDRVWTAVFSPDGTKVLTGSEDRTARLWDVSTGQLLRVFTGHEARVSSVGFSPDGRYIVTASDDRTARVWDTATGQQVALLGGHDGSVVSAMFSPDGQSVVTASLDGTARIWRLHLLPLAAQIEWARAARFDPLSSSERARLGLGPPAGVRVWPDTASKCDEAAAALYDPDRRAPGWLLQQINPELATRVCAGGSGDGAQLYEWGRALAASGRFRLAHEAFEQALGLRYRAAAVDLADLLTRPDAGMLDGARAVALYEQAFNEGVTQAGFRLGEAYEQGVKGGEVTPDRGRAWLWYEKAAAAGDPGSLARLGEREDAAAAQAPGARRQALLLEAFRYYAAAAERARVEDWPDQLWRPWRYRRASLARLLAREGMTQDVADVYRDVEHQYALPPTPLWQQLASRLSQVVR